jgi:TolB-like protein/tRNA A-37 threonylcarbamoyl transferase component Bud32
MTDPLESLRSALEGRYDVQRLIGQGGMATVYLAEDCRHGRSVAIKVLRPELAVSIGADRFLREIRVAAQLQHPNILALYDSGEAAGFLYYVMPFVQGESLRGLLDRETQLSLPDAIQITCDIADALYCAHTHHVIHRDIKPENILLQDGRPLVADFGIARAVKEAGGDKLTETGMAVGTPHYMSPEQGLGGERIDGRTDQYSLACMLYEMLVGQPPFHGPNAMAILARHSMETVPSLQVVRNSVPDEIEDAIMRALEKTPADRFPTVRDFADALAAVDLGPSARRTSSRSMRARRSTPQAVRRRSGAVVAAEPVSIPARVLSFARPRGKGFWAGAVALVLMAVALPAWWIWLRPGAASSSTAGFSPNRIAVMYFENRGGQDSLGYVADGLTEALIRELSQVKTLQVISRNGVSPYKKTNVASDSVARALKVGTLVTGDIAQSADRLRVNVSLINAASGTEIGSKTLERPRQEIFALQDDLAKEVAIFLRQRLGQEVEVQRRRERTTSAIAWEQLQKADQEATGVDALVTAGDVSAATRQLARADALLSQAETADPRWVTPITQRGWLAYREARLSGSFDKTYYAERIAKGLGHAERALRLQPNDPDALELRGTLRYLRWLLNLAPDGSEAAQLLTDAERDLRASVASNTTQASAWTTLSHLLINKLESAEAKLAALRAYDADPYLAKANLTVWRLFSTSLDLEDGVEANHWCAEGQRRFPTDPRFTECQIWLFALKGQKPDIDKAWELLEEYLRLSPPNQRDFLRLRGQMLVAMALARAGLADSAKAVAVRSRADANLDPPRELVSYEAIVRTILGEKDEAIRLLGHYYATNPQQRSSADKDESWWYRDLKGDPRYEALVGPSLR